MHDEVEDDLHRVGPIGEMLGIFKSSQPNSTIFETAAAIMRTTYANSTIEYITANTTPGLIWQQSIYLCTSTHVLRSHPVCPTK